MNDLKSRLRNLREQNKLTRKELGEKISASHDQIYNWETGRGEPDSEMFKKLATFYAVSTDYLLGKVANPHDELVPEKKQTPADTAGENIGDPVLDEIANNLKQMSPEEREAVRRLTQSVANRETKSVG